MATRVATEGYLHVFDITTDYGPLEAEGIGMLLVRLHEVTALAQLDEISKSEVLLKSAGTSVLNLGKGVASVVKDPESTVKGIGGSVKRFGGNLGRKAKGAVDTDGAPVRRRDGLLDVRNQLRSAELDAESGCRPVGHHEPVVDLVLAAFRRCF